MENGIVISSRARIARNIKGTMFPPHTEEKDIEIIKNSVGEALKDAGLKFSYFELKDMSYIDTGSLTEKRIITKDLLRNKDTSSFYINKENREIVMINEEDQIRIQCIEKGLELNNAWRRCNEIDDMIDKKIEYAFDYELGYLTTCPTNTGTGLRISVMLHLPFLVKSKIIDVIVRTIGQIGVTVRGLYGEGSRATGNIFQVSNQTTLGESESETIGKLENLVLELIEKEKYLRMMTMKNEKIELEDKVYRSLGILQNARKIKTNEAMTLLSNIRIGQEQNILDIGLEKLDDLLIDVQPLNIQKLAGKELSNQNRDIKRAEIIKEKLL